MIALELAAVAAATATDGQPAADDPSPEEADAERVHRNVEDKDEQVVAERNVLHGSRPPGVRNVQEEPLADRTAPPHHEEHEPLDILRPLLIVLAIPFTLVLSVLPCALLGALYLIPLAVIFSGDLMRQCLGMEANIEAAYSHEGALAAEQLPSQQSTPHSHSSSHGGVRVCGWIALPFMAIGSAVAAIAYSAILTLVWFPLCGMLLGCVWIPQRMLRCAHIREKEFNPFLSVVTGVSRMISSWKEYFKAQQKPCASPAARPSLPVTRSPSYIHPFRYVGITTARRWADEEPISEPSEHVSLVFDPVHPSRAGPPGPPGTPNHPLPIPLPVSWLLRNDIPSYAAVGIGGALGSLVRFAFGLAFSHIDTLESVVTSPLTPWTRGAVLTTPSPTSFIPLSTFCANLSGCLLIGVFATVVNDPLVSAEVSPLWRPFLVTGVCGGLTTFSTLMLETIELALQAEMYPEQAWQPILNIVLHHVACVLVVLAACLTTEKMMPYVPAYRSVQRAVAAAT